MQKQAEKTILGKSEIPLKGIHTFSFYNGTADRAIYLESLIQQNTLYLHRLFDLFWNKKAISISEYEECKRKLSTRYKELKDEMERKFLKNRFVVENITTTVGRAAIPQRLAGDYANPFLVSHTAVGDNNTSAAVGQTTLVNETSRKAVSDLDVISTTLLIETFFAKSEAVDTHEEYGNFIDGTASANSGILLNRFVVQTVKPNTQSMNVQSSILFSDA